MAKPHVTIRELDDEDYGRTNKVYHRIDMGDTRPIHQLPRRMPLAKQAEENEMLNDMQHRRVIQESDSPWSSPIVLVRNKNGKLCSCVDYRKLNDVANKDCFPLPRNDNTLNTLSGAKWFSTLHLKGGYW
jgi:hypothetical protein